ncbi:hypothetical protein ACF059_29205 [Streptomyces sp. NPDC016562]|uniref:hypothetical protein n=1 Tax=Streptomyces sp. NPDC016562 TaxID=3364966 RepID=UPI0037010E77
MLLADIGETTWRAACGRRSADQSSLMPHWIPQLPGVAEHTAAQDAELAGVCEHLSATLRRIRLVDPLTRSSGHVHLFTSRPNGDLHLIEACEATPTVLPLWTSRSLPLPLALWPVGPLPAPGPADPRAAVLDLLAEIEPAHTPSRSTGHRAARALCHLVGLSTAPDLVQAAEHALNVATHVLADPAHASVYAAGGWAGSCRTYPEGTVHGTDPCLPPGAETAIDLPEEALQRLGEHFSSQSTDASRTDLVTVGQEELVHLLDWALAAATRPSRHRAWNLNQADGTLQHTQPLPDREGTLALTASTTGVYRVSLDGLGLVGLADEDDTVEWEREAAPSQSAAVLLAEHAANEAAVCPPCQREHRKQRLVVPTAVADAPTIRSVLAGADHVLGFSTLASGLAASTTARHPPTGPPTATGEPILMPTSRETTRPPSPLSSVTGSRFPPPTTAKPRTLPRSTAPPTSATSLPTARRSTRSSPATSPQPTASPARVPSKSVTSPASQPCAPRTCPPWPARRFAPSGWDFSVWSGPSRRTPPN